MSEREALRNLAAEVGAIVEMCEDGLRQIVGSTNVACLMRRLDEAQAALADRPEQPVAHEPVGMVVDNEAALFGRFKGKLGNDTLLYAAPVARPEPLEQWRDDELADSPTPRAQEGTWTLTAPDGRTWKADSLLRCAAAETNDRVPADVQLARIARSIADDRPEPAQPVARVTRLILWGDNRTTLEADLLASMNSMNPGDELYAAPPSHPTPSEAGAERQRFKCSMHGCDEPAIYQRPQDQPCVCAKHDPGR